MKQFRHIAFNESSVFHLQMRHIIAASLLNAALTEF